MSDNLRGQLDISTTRRELFTFNSVTVTTNAVSASGTELFEISEDEDIVDSVSFIPDDRDLPSFGRLINIRVNIKSGSTDTTLSIYEDESGSDIHQVTEITNLDTNDSPESFNLANGSGLPFVNQNEENKLYLQIDEISGNQSEYEIKLLWSNVGERTGTQPTF